METGKKKMGIGKKIGIGVGIAFGVFILLGVIGLAIGGSGSNTSENTSQTQANNPSQTSPQLTAAKGSIDNPADINESVKVDNISYTLTRSQVTSTISSIEDADGQFVVLTLRVVNTGTESETIYSDDFKLIDTQGRKFSYDTATLYLDNSIFLSQINPGLPTTGRIAFDVPVTPDSYYLEIGSNKLFGESSKYIYVGDT
jgi:hypothetical protein